MGLRAARLLPDARLAQLAADGDERAFEVLYDRHHRALLGFCRHMVGSPDEAEDALQQTFLRAHGALRLHGAPDDPRPWLFAIARNRCKTLLAARRAEAEVDDEMPATAGLAEEVQARADLRAVVEDVARLPDDQRAALVLAELADLSHAQIGAVIGVRAEKVKALVHQARTTLIAERDARERPCEEVREVLATARGGALRRGPLRRHLRQCAPCRAYGDAVAEQRRALALALPVTPSLGLKAGIFGAASTATAGGGALAGLAAGGGTAAKVVVTVLAIGAAAGGGAAVVREVETAPAPRAAEAREVAASQAPAATEVAHPRAAPVASTVRPQPAVRHERVARRARHAKRRRRQRASFTPPGRSRRALAHARARGQQGKAIKLPGASRSAAAPPKPPHPARPVKPVKPVRTAKPKVTRAPEPLSRGQERRAAEPPKPKP